ncbi:hepatitis A virus cellular receptor 1 isoform X3 [Tupaia chinensis]|uniref:hepatitis A virus cellular receptor 1 isoform X3 n=1 Tax=Tupaia chinensis TaxID=246437 RepID=UPI0003C8F2C2|nr:hepatitis A virus cellular receptor 1 isoform X3 [Tupaia chinensis]
MHPWVIILSLILLLTDAAVSDVQIGGVVGQPVTLPCTYSAAREGVTSMCWGRGACPSFRCANELIYTDGTHVTYQQIRRYKLLGDLSSGDVSLTIEHASESDSGLYCCRIEIPGWFNDIKITLKLDIEPARTTSAPTTARVSTTAPTTPASTKSPEPARTTSAPTSTRVSTTAPTTPASTKSPEPARTTSAPTTARVSTTAPTTPASTKSPEPARTTSAPTTARVSTTAPTTPASTKSPEPASTTSAPTTTRVSTSAPTMPASTKSPEPVPTSPSTAGTQSTTMPEKRIQPTSSPLYCCTTDGNGTVTQSSGSLWHNNQTQASPAQTSWTTAATGLYIGIAIFAVVLLAFVILMILKKYYYIKSKIQQVRLVAFKSPQIGTLKSTAEERVRAEDNVYIIEDNIYIVN